MKFVLGIILLAVLVVGVATIPSVDAASGKLTIKGESSTIYSNESVYYKGKLTDSEGYAISFESINIWEKVNGEWQYVTQGKTDARGEYRITIPANHWNYAKTVNIIANSASSIQSPSVTLNIEKPYSYQIKPEVKNYVQPTASKNIITNLDLKLRESTPGHSIQFRPTLSTSDGAVMMSNSIDIYFNNKVIKTISSYEWSDDIAVGEGFFTFVAKFDGLTSGSTIYKRSTAQVNYDNTGKSSSSTQTTQKSSTTQTNSNELYKSAASTEFLYSDILNQIESGVKTSEYALSNSKLENSEAKKKIDSGWGLRYDVWQYYGEAKKKIDDAESHINAAQYDYSYKTLVDSESYIYKAKNHLYSILDELKDARDLEKKYQESLRSCVLFWCSDVKNTYGELDSNIKNLELKLNSLESRTNKLETSKNSFTQSLYKNEINEKNQEIKNLENVRKQEQVEAKQEQQRLQEQNKQTEILAKQEQQRLQEQKERELREQQYQAELERQRLKEQQQRELESKERQRLQQLANNHPLIQQIISGKIKFYVHPVPSYAGEGVANGVNTMFDSLSNGNAGFQRVYSEGEADLHFQWIRDFTPDRIGQNYKNFNQIALGTTNCLGDWRPFDLITVWKITWHELGHSIGYPHNNDYNDIMYSGGTGNNFSSDYEETIFLDEGYVKTIPFCGGGDFKYTLKSNNQYNGFKVYVVTPETNASDFIFKNIGKHYSSCGSNGEKMRTFSGECKNIPSGAKLLVYNPDELTQTSAINVSVEIFDIAKRKSPDMSFNESELTYSKELLDYVRSLF
ncbi:MAG: hypothetical protein OPY06_05095 [Nitrosopumilus sp.]|nr:hypothetical protein [Nitrosopumilus sp.]MDF2425947.1 hypothetical protein [Nitrosopumilus sp.]MDF2428414.1 hypothetical protein [Nitrosopumilus sp.]MDF2429887.1 hypothetical protein [Nitrosopumilus sp.]